MRINIENLIFCDDIRREINGKDILIGVYGADLIPSSIPADFPLAIWLKFTELAPGEYKFRVRLIAPENSESRVEGEISIIAADKPTIIAFSGIPIHAERYGDLVVLISINGEDDFEAGRLTIAPPANNAENQDKPAE